MYFIFAFCNILFTLLGWVVQIFPTSIILQCILFYNFLRWQILLCHTNMHMFQSEGRNKIAAYD